MSVPGTVNMNAMVSFAHMAANKPRQSSHQKPDAAALYRPDLWFPVFADWTGSFKQTSVEQEGQLGGGVPTSNAGEVACASQHPEENGTC